MELLRLLGRWRAEHASVADEATATNLRRLSWLAPVVALLNAIHVLAFYVQSTAQGLSEPTYRWIWALIWLHLSMGVFMVGCAVGARKLRFAVRSLRARILSTSVVLVGMLFAVLVVMVDQWITPNITPFLIACMVLSAVLYQQPQRSAWIFALTYGAFFSPWA